MKVRQLNKSGNFTFYSIDATSKLRLPYFSGGVKAGFPSPAADFMGESIDLNRELIKNKFETFIVKVDGDSMKDVGIHSGDRLIVDRSLPTEDGKIYVCCIDNEFTVKRIRIDKANKKVWLVAENEDFAPIEVTEENESFLVWGRVVHVLKDL